MGLDLGRFRIISRECGFGFGPNSMVLAYIWAILGIFLGTEPTFWPFWANVGGYGLGFKPFWA